MKNERKAIESDLLKMSVGDDLTIYGRKVARIDDEFFELETTNQAIALKLRADDAAERLAVIGEEAEAKA